MIKNEIYRVVRPGGGVDITPVKPDGSCETLYRLIAEDGCMLTDGQVTCVCIDTETPDAWTEIEDAELTDEDYAAAGRILLGEV